ncbi:RHD3/Sey1 [Infundibulicybe gibba]|nr:RHD3/Sey1 [Infundibulicybe gibba]
MSTDVLSNSSRTPVLGPGSPPTVTAIPLEQIQIVDDNNEFTKDLNRQLERWGLRDAGFGYNIVAALGAQSTGKSTLLNRLFGTSFDVMDETRRRKTTKGIWIGKGQSMNVMVMDVEGTDGHERGEDQDFERKSALFSLASSGVLIVNLWEWHQEGLYRGANMSLLKTVFEVNLRLFGRTNSRTLLLFVIRDHIGQTPLANLQATLTTELNRVWDGLSKPPELRDRELSDYFDMVFTALPHKILSPDKFESEIQNLRRRFVDKEQEGYLFKPAYHRRIPADGISFYMEGIWEQIQNNKDLDLSTQQERLAQFRCDEISNSSLAEFNERAESQKRLVETGHVLEGFGFMMSGWRGHAIERYNREASIYRKDDIYHKDTYTRKRRDLILSLDSALSSLFRGQLKNLHKACLLTFKQKIFDGLRGQDFKFSKSGGVGGGILWGWGDEELLLREEMESVADQCRRDETEKIVNLIERDLEQNISELVESRMDKASPDMWDSILKAFEETLSDVERSYLSEVEKFDCPEEENASSLNALRARAWQALRTKVGEQTTDVILRKRVRARFDKCFQHDEQGMPRVWKPEDDVRVDEAFGKAKDQALALIPLFVNVPLIYSTPKFTPSNETADLLSADESNSRKGEV